MLSSNEAHPPSFAYAAVGSFAGVGLSESLACRGGRYERQGLVGGVQGAN